MALRKIGLYRPLTTKAERTYDDAIKALNTLQTPYSTMKLRWDAGDKVHESANKIQLACLAQIGQTQNDLEKLNIIHVAGTKGKGTVCAYVDSILSQHLASQSQSHTSLKKIGLFTSPHLISVRERIRINSSPLSSALFTKYFFDLWDLLSSAPSLPKPVYFRFLCLLSYHVFLSEGVNVAIYETGMGGHYDATNVVERPAVTGITSLGIDHTFVLGETIEQIAWHKAGIQKEGVRSFTVRQGESAMGIIERRAKEKGVLSLEVVDVDRRLEDVEIKPDADFQRGNASLAIRLAETVLQKIDPAFKVDKGRLPKEFRDGLEKVVWRGRCEKKVEGNVSWYLDGAHTKDSIAVAAKWFGDEAAKSKPGPKILIFNQQGQREAVELLEGLYHVTQGIVHFDHVIFCTTSLQPASSTSKDHINHNYDLNTISNLTLQKSFAEKWHSLSLQTQTQTPSPKGNEKSPVRIEVIPCLEDAIEYVRKLEDGTGEEEVSALITGSVHLVGRALGILEDVDAL